MPELVALVVMVVMVVMVGVWSLPRLTTWMIICRQRCSPCPLWGVRSMLKAVQSVDAICGVIVVLMLMVLVLTGIVMVLMMATVMATVLATAVAFLSHIVESQQQQQQPQVQPTLLCWAWLQRALHRQHRAQSNTHHVAQPPCSTAPRLWLPHGCRATRR